MRAEGLTAKVFSVVLAGWNVSLLSQAATAQTIDLCPEVDAYVSLSKSARLWVQADRTREEGSPVQSEIGPSLQLSLKPLLKLRQLTERQPDKFKSRTLNLTIGYRYLQSAGNVTENRIVLEASPRFPLVWKILVTDRNRGELRWINGGTSWRYRNRLTMEREVSVGSYAFTPYIRGEGYFDSNFNKWSATALIAGIVFPFKKHFELEPTFQHMNQTGGRANQQVETLGLTLSMYF
ncbi:MAG: DUF2490 domain-containing protein [Acidobacteriia bacterium]|nr:DUF2490 domain-containing protein [Terriglobia bacterium]